MISIGNEQWKLDHTCLGARGGFLWWYVDLIDADGNGLVLIWSFGLPFLPGYAHASRSGRAQLAGTRPSLNVAIYQKGKLDCYLLQEYSPAQVEWNPEQGTWRFGNTQIHTRLEGNQRVVDITLDCPMPAGAGRLTGSVRVQGAVPQLEPKVPENVVSCHGTEHDHAWIPLAVPARGEAKLRCGKTHYAFDGRAYHDCNVGARPLHDLGIKHWVWGRAAFKNANSEPIERVYYALWSKKDSSERSAENARCFGLDFHQTGRVEHVDNLRIKLIEERRNLGGVLWWPHFELHRPDDPKPWLEVKQKSVVDSGPFYMRHITQNQHQNGTPVVGFNETICPERIDLSRYRPLVGMRVHHVGDSPEPSQTKAKNSMWLPLFSGPRRGRVRRLGRQTVAALLFRARHNR